MTRTLWRYAFIAFCLLVLGGCQFIPQITREPSVFNPFPQLSRVAVAPFFNLSAEATVDGRQFALAYAAELQSIPGFEVIPVGVVEAKMQEYRIQFGGGADGAAEARKLAQLLGADAVVVGAVTDYSPYYPPRCGIDVEWYAANPGFHPIPAGYGLPWGTQGEEEIPDALIFEAERALAREQLRTQEPPYEPPPIEPPPAPETAAPPEAEPPTEFETRRRKNNVQLVQHEQELPAPAAESAAADGPAAGAAATSLPSDWPDPRGFTPAAPMPERPPLRESNLPVLKHVRLYRGTDPRVTEALETYVYFRDDARFGGWQSYLQRSEDFIRFCCHLHVTEMLTARGGAGQTRVVIRKTTGR
jgi:hypothetical protein